MILDKRSISRFTSRYANEKTKEKYRIHLTRFINKIQGKHINWEDRFEVEDIIIQYRDNLVKEGKARNYINLSLSAIFNFLAYYEIKFNKSGIMLKINRYDNTSRATKEYAKELFKIIAKEKNKLKRLRDKTIFQIFIFLGIRKSAMINIRVEDVYEYEGRPMVKLHEKNYRTLDRELPTEVYNSILKLVQLQDKQPEDYLFTGLSRNHCKRMDESSLNYILKTYTKNLPDDCKVHDLRALAAHLLYKETGDIRKVKELLGHNDIRTTDIYISKLESQYGSFHNSIKRAFK